MRHRTAVTLIFVLTLVLTAACGGASEDDRSAAPEAPSDAGPRTFVDVRGEPIEVPGDPQRIVAIHDSNGGMQVLELGFELLGFPTRGGKFGPEITARYDLEGITDVGEVYEPNVEAIATLQPDLIVGEGYAGDGMNAFMPNGVEEQLQQIAPTVYIDVFRPVEDVMADFAELLGPRAEERYQELGGKFAESLDSYSSQLEDADGLSAVFVQHLSGGTLALWGSTAVPLTTILTELGIPQPPITEAADEPKNGGYLGSVSLERIPDMSSDIIFLEHKTPGEDDQYQDDYTGHPLWQALPAVEGEQVHLTDEMYYGTTFGVYQYVLDQIGPALVSADEGTVEASWENSLGE